MDKLKKGQRVKHTSRPEWGLGQFLEDENAGEISVFFEDNKVGVVNLAIAARDRLRVVTGPEAQSVLLDNLDLVDGERVTLAMAKQRFLKQFPGGFYGKRLLDEERDYKDELARVAQQLLAKDVLLPLIEAENYQQVCEQANKLVSYSKKKVPNNLPSFHEKIDFKAGFNKLNDPKAFAHSLFEYLHGDGDLEPKFTRFAQVLGQMEAAKWPIITTFRFFLFPATDVFIKPETLKFAAEVSRFGINYRPQLNWLTYCRVTQFYQYLFDNLAASTADLKPRDMIDVQSFIWCIDPGSY